MITQDQREIVEFLGAPETHGGAPVERIDTHASIVFLAGRLAWKLKRAVRYDYLDFSSAERRRQMCEAEVRLNRRTAPQLYRRVAPITRQADGSLAIAGSGRPVDWLVEMHRFDQEGLLDRLAARGALALDLMHPLAAAIARLHAGAEAHHDRGGAAGMSWVVEGNAAAFADEGTAIFPPAAVRALTAAARTAIERLAGRLDARRDAGLVRRCHGDLHLRNIVLIDGLPTLFDGIEFNDDIACTDVLYDLAFLLMDLWRRRMPLHASIVWNDYLRDTLDLDGVALMPLFLSCRAAVRAKTSASAAALQEDALRRAALEALAREYLDLARDLLDPAPACLVAIGGFSGSGKSTLARSLAPLAGAVPGAVVLRSDEVRKALFGLAPAERLGPAGYTPEVTHRVYATLEARARAVLRGGHAAIVDAVFARPEDRERIAEIAAAAGVPLVGLWLDAPESVLMERLSRRRDDPSDADPAVLRAQLMAGAGTIGWHRLCAASGPQDVLRQAVDLVARTSALCPAAVA
jgi:uncharacterized protein